VSFLVSTSLQSLADSQENVLVYSCWSLNASLSSTNTNHHRLSSQCSHQAKELLPARISTMINPNAPPNECSCLQAKVHIKFIISIPRTESHCQTHAAIASMPLVLFSSSSTFPLSPNPGIYFAKSFNVKGLASSSLRCQYTIKKRGGEELTSIPNLLHHTQHHFLRRRLLHRQK
jgi:hypothetical protein